ncbi:MAG: glycosyltransferase family 4 protein [Phycisphaerae bacterium]|nr:glycosyltransferase family 4 protein [Phycisphaerae bacterium]
MKIVYLAAGAAGQYCGACARDAALARSLIALGHEVTMLPLYTPLRLDGPDPSDRRVFYGGISAVLQQKFALFRHTPKLLDRLFDSRWILRAVSRLAIDTQPEDLGAMTVSVLRGSQGRQAKELRALLDYLHGQGSPDVVNLTNSLLAGLAPAIRERLGCRIVCMVQGEEAFVRDLPPPFRDEAMALVRLAAEDIDLFIAPAAGYADEVAEFLGVGRDRIRVVHPGVDVGVFRPAVRSEGGPVHVGYLSRIAPAKGLDILCRAAAIVHRERPGQVRLSVAGQLAPADRRWWQSVLDETGLQQNRDGFAFRGQVTFGGKLDLFQSLDVFVRPSRQPERRAVAALEAMACGAVLVAPRNGILAEIVESTGGGMLVDPCGAESLAAALVSLADDRRRLTDMSVAAARGVETHFSSRTMAETTLRIYADVLGV